jgi:amidase
VSDLHDLTALEQGAAIKAGEVGSAELVEHYLERVGRLDESLGACVTVTADRAREAAD